MVLLSGYRPDATSRNVVVEYLVPVSPVEEVRGSRHPGQSTLELYGATGVVELVSDGDVSLVCDIKLWN